MNQGGSIELRGLNPVKELLAGLGGELGKASELAQNKMAYEIAQAEKEQMRTDLDRPTPWTVGSLRYKKVGASPVGAPKVEGAAVYFETPWGYSDGLGADEWLGVQILGGSTAGPKRSEARLQMLGWMPRDKVWVPAVGTRLDRYGNVPGSLISDMLSNLGANPYGRNADPSAVRVRYLLVGEPGREEGVFQKLGGDWVPFLWFVDRETYRKRFDFYGRADREVRQGFAKILDTYLDKALGRLGRR